ncbi:MAG: helix-turn-helix domain-containing protein [Clostridiales bacterium]|nr:helix-turn-helix domain-containing protein [Candidatus Blautia equi]
MKEQFLKSFDALDTEIFCVRKNNPLPLYKEVTFHNHDGYEIWLVLNDGANYYVESQGKRLERGDLILISPYAFHYVESKQHDAVYERVFINMKESFFSKLGSSTSMNLKDCFTRTSDHALNLIHLTEEEIPFYLSLTDQLRANLDEPTSGSDLMVPALMTQILVFLNRKATEETHIHFHNDMPKIVKDCISYINDNLTEDISMNSISDHLHHNSDYINRRFKVFTGITVAQFILIKRITLAQKYLRQGTPPSDACYLCGFNNYSNFSRTFSKHTGFSPKQYQLAQRME